MADYYKPPDTRPTPVEHSDESTPEVGKIPFSPLPEVAAPQDTEKIAYNNNGWPIPQRNAFVVSRKRLYIGLAIAILVIIAAIVGTVVGVLEHNKRSQNQGSDTSHNNSETNPSSENKGTSIWKNSTIGVTGWRYGDGYRMRLFYQDQQGYLKMASMSSSSSEKWTEKAFTFGKAKLGTPIAASSHNRSIYEEGTSSMQVHIFYLDESSTLQEYIISWDGKNGEVGPLNARNIKVLPDTRLASYWPSLVYQNPDNSISEMRYNCTNGKTNDCWNEQKLDLMGAGPSTPLAEVPKGKNLTGTWLYYQREDGGLMDYSWNNGTGEWGKEHFATPIPKGAPLAVLADPRNEDGAFLNFVAVWQDPTTHEIQYSWKNGNRWNVNKSSSAFDNAMNGTNIACSTAASWWDKRLLDGPDLSRCFFLGDDERLRQVQWLGKSWQDMGYVDIQQEEVE